MDRLFGGAVDMFDPVHDSVVIRQLEKKNYLIEYDKESDNSTCAIYFSSHGVYYPETLNEFKKIIVEKNYFEWYGTRVPNCKKHIFVRDIIKQFYVEGINTEINTLEKLIVFLKKETVGYNVICVGSSSGGYAAALIGAILGAKIVFCYSGKFSLRSDFAYKTKEKLLYHENDELYNKYYESYDYINKGRTPIIYIYPSKSVEDLVQREFVIGNRNVIHFPVEGKNHGVCLYPEVLPLFMNLSIDSIIKLSAYKNRKPISIGSKLIGARIIFVAIRFYITKIKRKVLSLTLRKK